MKTAVTAMAQLMVVAMRRLAQMHSQSQQRPVVEKGSVAGREGDGRLRNVGPADESEEDRQAFAELVAPLREEKSAIGSRPTGCCQSGSWFAGMQLPLARRGRRYQARDRALGEAGRDDGEWWQAQRQRLWELEKDDRWES